MEKQSKKSSADQKMLIIAVIFLLVVIGIVVAILALLMQGDDSIDPRFFEKMSCELENPSAIEANACLRSNCTFVSSVCDTSCPFDFESDPVTGCQISCECAPAGLFQGDVRFLPSQVKSMSERYGYVDEDDFDLFYGSAESTTVLWKDHEVNGRYQIGYVFDPAVSLEKRKVAVIEKVIKRISETTCIDFVPKTNEKHYITFNSDLGCSSLVGSLEYYESPQIVSLAWGCDLSRTVHHELKHLLGFEHEHTRADRDAYVTVRMDNVKEGKEMNFIKLKKDTTIKIGVPYDIGSVMQYFSTFFMKAKNAYTVVEYGTEKVLKFTEDHDFTEYDAFEVNKLYDCLDPVTTATWTEWSEWSHCDATCGKGEKYKYRRCENAEGKHGIGCPGEPSITEPCESATACPPRGVWEEWGEWGECMNKYGGQYRFKERKCTVFGECDASKGSMVEDCVIEIETSTTWGAWSTCSATCNGKRVRQKLCDGQICPNQIPYYGLCNTDCAVTAPVEQITWTQWTQCSASCDGTRSRQRLCENNFCEGSSPVKEECNVGRCGNQDWFWSVWLDCTATCDGTQTRFKVCGQSLCTGENSVKRECNTGSCTVSESFSHSSTLYMTTTTPGLYSSTLYTTTTTTPESYSSALYTTTTTTTTPENAGDWGLWSSCSATCDGTRIRQRSCRTFCYNPESETENCNVGLCSTNRGTDGMDENTSLFDVKEDSVPDLCGGAGSQWYFGDFNGDRRTDAACIELDGNVAIGHTTTSGSMTELHWKGKISPCASADIYFGDVNGDRRDDFVCKDSARRKLIIRYTTEAGVFGDIEVDGGSFCTDPSEKLFALDIDGTKTMDLLCHFADNHIELRLNSNFRPF
ncbi:uncharacterized protein LOC120333888 isoform X1 [Styela clava]